MSGLNRNSSVIISYDNITSEYLKKYGEESLLILCLLSRNYTIRGELVFNLYSIYEYIGVSRRSTSKRKGIKKSIEKMFNIKINDDNRIVNVAYEPIKSNFLIITDREVDRILKYKGMSNIYGIFNTYVMLKRYVNKGTKTSYPSIDKIMDTLNINSNNTVIKYIKILENYKMVSCERHDAYVLRDGKVKKPNNTYRILM